MKRCVSVDGAGALDLRARLLEFCVMICARLCVYCYFVFVFRMQF